MRSSVLTPASGTLGTARASSTPSRRGQDACLLAATSDANVEPRVSVAAARSHGRSPPPLALVVLMELIPPWATGPAVRAARPHCCLVVARPRYASERAPAR